MANATNMSRVLDIVESAASADSVILISSAIKGCTDSLIEIGRRTITGESFTDIYENLKRKHHEIAIRLFTGGCRERVISEVDALFSELLGLTEESKSGKVPEDRFKERVQTFGELFSTKILEAKLATEGYATKWIDSRDIVVKGDNAKTYANIASATSDKSIRIFVAPGFVARDLEGNICTLGRGGSDLSAALFAAGSGADCLQIWTDVPGVMTTNPKDVPAAHTITTLSYKAAFDLAQFGAKVLYAPTVAPAREAAIPFSILNTFDPQNPGTIVCDPKGAPAPRWLGVTSMNGKDADVSEIHLVGEGALNRAAAVARSIAALKKAGVQIIDVTEDEGADNITALVHRSQAREAVAALHREFFEERVLNVINVFIAGYGAVGKALAKTIAKSADRIADRTGRSIRILGVSNSRRYVIDLKGIAPAEVEARLASGSDASDGAFVDAVLENAPRRAVFVDCTPSEDLYSRYVEMFRKGLSVVSSNRRALAVPYAQYAALKSEAREYGVGFKYDTTVGTALPILESIASGTNSCDSVVSIEAMVSCTINNILTQYDGPRGETFAALLRRAQYEGLTEKDPRQDLGGRDALRKLLILAREAGIPMEENDVEITPMLDPEFFECSLDEFYSKVEESEGRFIERENELDAMAMRQRFVASVERSASSPLGYKASIKMRLVGKDSPFYWISGTENVTIVKSEYSAAPLVLRGAGEGARGAASGIINDILTL